MPRKTIIEQIKSDYSNYSIIFNEKTALLKINDKTVNLMMDRDEIKTINVNSHSGKNRYQAITQFLYEKYKFIPVKDSMADGLIQYKEEYTKYKLQNLAQDYCIGFLEDGDRVVAIPVDSNSQKKILIEENTEAKEKAKLRELKQKEGLSDDFGYLYELKDEFIVKERKNRK